MIPPAMSTGLLLSSAVEVVPTPTVTISGKYTMAPKMMTVENGSAEAYAAARRLGERIRADNIRDHRTWRRVEIRRGHYRGVLIL